MKARGHLALTGDAASQFTNAVGEMRGSDFVLSPNPTRHTINIVLGGVKWGTPRLEQTSNSPWVIDFDFVVPDIVIVFPNGS